MAKASGLGQTTLSIDDSAGSARAIKNDITNWQMATPRGVQDITGVDKSANERLLLLADASVTLNGVFNAAANQSHDVFKTVSSTSVARTVTQTVNGVTLAFEALFSDYALTRADSGELTWSAPGALADGTVPTWA
ncbi:hypothetical protein ABZT03_11685 [Streptomyces sp. NPDC005574]|uniref:hypothetical protein n=1 Tax=Streptomyces sp. NPDC005574 TaxID=3156891 RepID=UPI0033B174A2